MLITNWYRKPTFSGRYTNYFTSNPTTHKINVVTGLTDRAILLSDNRFHNDNITVVKEILIQNCYPLDLINKYIHKRRKSIKYRSQTIDCVPDNNNSSKNDNNNNNNDNNDNDNDNSNHKHFVSIPYVKGVSENLSGLLKDCQFRTVYSVFKKLNSLIKLGKDRLSKGERTGVVYQINCMDCEACYIGQTKRHLNTRIREHQLDITKKIIVVCRS
ncbi:DNA cross-link repair 1 protein-like [Ooceraea biroi]|uniref:DNA cross-link repair 1 protein-like n=1 Tax=Ooceraea biroi TaxID=2015173 RepID=UPI000F08D6D0|nr:DNA cross-link repair 1 protein-like [Ooceraea biroi]